MAIGPGIAKPPRPDVCAMGSGVSVCLQQIEKHINVICAVVDVGADTHDLVAYFTLLGCRFILFGIWPLDVNASLGKTVLQAFAPM
jgi:hypothetical protein